MILVSKIPRENVKEKSEEEKDVTAEEFSCFVFQEDHTTAVYNIFGGTTSLKEQAIVTAFDCWHMHEGQQILRFWVCQTESASFFLCDTTIW